MSLRLRSQKKTENIAVNDSQRSSFPSKYNTDEQFKDKQIDKAPHELKNKWITSGYRFHTHWTQTVEHWWSITNETWNIYTGALQLIIAGMVLSEIFLYIEAEHWSHNIWLISAAFCNMIGSLLVVFYHTVCSYEPAYHLASACDLVGVSFSGIAMTLALGSANVTAWPLPHKLTFGDRIADVSPSLNQMSIQFEQMLLKCDQRILRMFNTSNSFTAALNLKESPGILILLLISFVSMAFVFVIRSRMRREGPAWLLFLNVFPAVLTGLAYSFNEKMAMLLGSQHDHMLFMACMYIGIFLYRSKIPERFFHARFDYFGNSHQVWHVLYTLGIGILTHDCLTMPKANK